LQSNTDFSTKLSKNWELGIGKINPWSGQISKIFSLEEIISQDFLKTLALSPNTTLTEVIIDKSPN